MSKQSPVYLLALLKVEDMASLRADYGAPLQAINARHGVETVIATPDLNAMEGEARENLVAFLRFPSQTALDAWYADPEYQPLITVRQNATDPAVSRLIALTPVG